MKDRSLEEKIGQELETKGIAENAKGGAVVVLSSREVVYIRGLSGWDDSSPNP